MADEVKIKIGVDASKVKPALQQAGNQAKTSLNNISTAGNKATSSLNGVAKAADNIGKASAGSSGLLQAIKGLGPAGMIAAAGIGLVVSAYQKLKQKAEEYKNAVLDLNKKSNAAGINASSYLQLEFAARHSGIELENVLKVMKNISDVVDKARSGNQKYVETFNQLGIALRDIERLSPDKQLERINNAISQYGLNDKQLEATFGKENAKTLRDMQNNGFNNKKAAAESMGIVGPMREELEMLEARAKADEDRKRYRELKKRYMPDDEELFPTQHNIFSWDESLPLEQRTLHFGEREGYLNPHQQLKSLIKNGKLTEEDIKKIFYERLVKGRHIYDVDFDHIMKQLKDADWDVEQVGAFKLNNQAAYRAVAELLQQGGNSNVKLDNPFTWVAKDPGKIQTPEEKAQAQAKNAADLILSNINAQIEANSKNVEVLDDMAKVDAEIAAAEKKLKEETKDQNAQLDEQIKKEIYIAALKNRDLKLQKTLKENEEKGNAAFSNAFFNLASQGSGLTPEVFVDYVKLIKKFSPNFDLEGALLHGTGFTSLTELMKASPDKYFNAIRNFDITKYQPKGSEAFDKELTSLKERGSKESAASAMRETDKLQKTFDKLDTEITEAENANKYIKDYSTKEGQEYLQRRKSKILQAHNILPTPYNMMLYDEWANGIIKKEDKLSETKRKSSMEAQSLSLEHDTELEHLKALQAAADDNEQRRLQTQIDELEKINLLMKEGANYAEAKARAAKGEADELLRKRKENEKAKNLRSIAEDTNKTRWDNIVNDYVVNRNFGPEYEQALIKQQLVNMGIPESQWKDFIPAIRKQNAQKQKANALRLSNSYTGVAESNYSDILRLMGRSKQANRYDALVSARNELGTNLTKEQTNWVNKMSDLQYEIKNFKMPEQKDASIVTNDLASRGGFSESVRVSYHDNSAKILQACRELVNLSKRNNELQKEKEAVF